MAPASKYPNANQNANAGAGAYSEKKQIRQILQTIGMRIHSHTSRKRVLLKKLDHSLTRL